MNRTTAEKAAWYWTEMLMPSIKNIGEAAKLDSPLSIISGVLNNDELALEYHEALSTILENKELPVEMYCDYHPDPLLIEAGDSIGLYVSMLDILPKHGMSIKPTGIYVSEGYGKLSKQLV